MAPPSGSALRRTSVLMGTVFIDMVGFSMVLTQLPFYAKELGASDSIVGLLIAAFALAQLATAPLWGRFSDRFGRRPALLCGLWASAIAFVLFGLAGSLWTLLVSRLAQGAGGGTVGVAQAYVGDAVGPGDRAKVLGWVSAAGSAGVMFGPTLGSLAFHLGPAAPGFLAAAFCLLNIAFAWRWLPESSQRDRPRSATPTSIRSALWDVLRHPTTAVPRLIWIYALGMLAFMSLNGVLVLYLARTFDFSETTIGWFYAYVAGISVVMRAILLGPIVTRFGEVRTLQVGIALMATGLFLIPLATNLPTLALVSLFMPTGTALLFPATSSLISQYAPDDERGQAMGVQQAFGGMSRLIGPIWSTLVFQYAAVQTPFWVAGLMMVGVGVLGMGVAAKAEPSVTAPSA